MVVPFPRGGGRRLLFFAGVALLAAVEVQSHLAPNTVLPVATNREKCPEVIAQLYKGFLSKWTETENQNGSVYYTGPTSIEYTIYSRRGRRAGNRARHRTKPGTVARTGRRPGL